MFKTITEFGLTAIFKPTTKLVSFLLLMVLAKLLVKNRNLIIVFLRY